MKTNVIIYGTFDLFHIGHENILRRAREIADSKGGKLIVGVTTRFFDIRRGKNNVMEATATRIRSVKNSGYADIVIKEKYKEQKIDDIKKYNISAIVFGSDWKGKMDYLKEYCEVIYLPRTEGISSTILRQEKMPFDVVVPYVNPNDEKWINLYDEYKKEGSETYKDKRFRDTSFLKYVLKSIIDNLPHHRYIYLVVQSKSQVPDWITDKSIKVITHSQFIPNEFLPTFNCNTIEMFMHRIPNLSEYFVYFNDDTILNKRIKREELFKNGACNLKSIPLTEDVGKNTWYNCLLNNTRVVNHLLNIEEDDTIWHKFPHTITPLMKSKCEELFEKIKYEIYHSITRFRDIKNFNQHLYAYYIEKTQKSINFEGDITVDYVNLHRCTEDFLKSANAITLCINDCVKIDEKRIMKGHSIAKEWLENKFFKPI